MMMVVAVAMAEVEVEPLVQDLVDIQQHQLVVELKVQEELVVEVLFRDLLAVPYKVELVETKELIGEVEVVEDIMVEVEVVYKHLGQDLVVEVDPDMFIHHYQMESIIQHLQTIPLHLLLLRHLL